MFEEYKGFKKEIYVVVLAKMIASMGSFIYPVLTLILSTKLGMDATHIAVYTFLSILVIEPFNFVGGKLADTLSKRNIIITCNLIAFFLFFVGAIMPISLAHILVYGMATIFLTIASASYDALLIDLSTFKNVESVFSLEYLASNVGTALTPLIASLLFDNYLNLAFFLNSVALFINCILLIKYVKDETLSDRIQTEYQKSLDHKINPIKLIFRNKALLLFLIFTIFEHIAVDQYSYLMPLQLQSIYGDEYTNIYALASFLEILVIAGITGYITIIFKDARNLKKLSISSVLILVSFIIFAIGANSVYGIYLSVTLFTISEIFATISYIPYLSKRVPGNYFSRIHTIITSIASYVWVVVEMIEGKIIDGFGYGWAWVFVIGLCLFKELSLHFLEEKDKKVYKTFYKEEENA